MNVERWTLDVCFLIRKQQFISRPARCGDKQHQPHIGDGRLRVHECLQAKRKHDRRPPADAFVFHPPSPRQQQYRNQSRGDRRRKSRRKIIFAKHAVTQCLKPVSKRRFIEPVLIVEVAERCNRRVESFPAPLQQIAAHPDRSAAGSTSRRCEKARRLTKRMSDFIFREEKCMSSRAKRGTSRFTARVLRGIHCCLGSDSFGNLSELQNSIPRFKDSAA